MISLTISLRLTFYHEHVITIISKCKITYGPKASPMSTTHESMLQIVIVLDRKEIITATYTANFQIHNPP